MKRILLLSIATAMLVSCGKNSGPAELDMRDDDGDQILNFLETSELDRYVSNFQQISSKKAALTMRLKTTTGDFKVVETEISFNKNIKEEITKSVFRNFDSTIINFDSDYFSEFSTAKVQEVAKKVSQAEIVSSGSELQISFENEEMNNDYISVIKKVKGAYQEILTGRIQGRDLKLNNLSGQKLMQDFLNGDEIIFVNNSNMDRKHQFFEKTINQEIKEKTYRLIISTPEETNIYYVSTALSIQGFLDLAKIDLSGYQFRNGTEYISLYGDTKEIDDRHFLLPINFHFSSLNSKMMPGLTYGIYVNKVSNLKKDYMNLFSTNSGSASRPYQQSLSFNFKKKLTKEIVIDLDITKTLHTLSNTVKRVHYSNSNGPKINTCMIWVIEPSGIHSINANILANSELGLNYTLDGKPVTPQEFIIEKYGRTMKRLIFKQTGEDLKLHFPAPVPNAKYGCSENQCAGTNDNPEHYRDCKLQLMVDEASLSVFYQAYIE